MTMRNFISTGGVTLTRSSEINVFDTSAQTLTLNLGTEFGASFEGFNRLGVALAPSKAGLGELGGLVKGRGLDFRNSNDDLTRVLDEAINGDGIDNVTARIVDAETIVLTTAYADAASDTLVFTGTFVEGFLEESFGSNYVQVNNDAPVSRGTINVFDNHADDVVFVANTAFGEGFHRSDKAGLVFAPSKSGLGELGGLVKGRALDFRNTYDDLTRVLDEAINGDGIDHVRTELVSDDTVRLITEYDGAAEDTVTLTGDFVEGFLAESFGDNFLFVDGGLPGKRAEIDVKDDVAEEVVLVVDTAFGDALAHNGERLGLALADNKSGLGELGSLIKGRGLDYRRTDDDLDRVIEEALLGDGINGVDAQIVDDATVTLVTSFGDAQDTITITGSYVETFIDEHFASLF